MNSKQTSLFLLSLSTLIFCFFIYHLYFQKHFQTQELLSEIETLKIDSTNVYQYSFDSTQTYYQFWVGGKYKIDVTFTKAKPFSSVDRQEVSVRDIEGKFVMTYDTKYHYSTLECPESDYIRLMKYLNIQHR
jgi:hypothetical protein